MSDTMDARPDSQAAVLQQAAALLAQGDDDALFEAILAGVAQISAAGELSLLAAGPSRAGLRVVASYGSDGTEPRQLPPELVETALAEGQLQLGDPATGQDLLIPLRCGGRTLGLIHSGRLPAPVEEAHRPALLALANLAAAALERARLKASLAAAEQARREYVSLTTHQLRVPLTSISGFTDLMLSGIAGSLTERQEEFMLTVQRNVGRMTVLIADLSDLNRIEDGRMPLALEAIELPALVESVLEKEAPRIQARGHHLLRQLPAGLPAAFGDRAAMHRIFEKILDNAIRYTPDGGQLTVAVLQQGGRLQVTVADNGIGIEHEDQAQLFSPFFRSEAAVVREHTGWGLSLALARALLAAQGGELWYESEPGRGAIFHFALPAAPAA